MCFKMVAISLILYRTTTNFSFSFNTHTYTQYTYSCSDTDTHRVTKHIWYRNLFVDYNSKWAQVHQDLCFDFEWVWTFLMQGGAKSRFIPISDNTAMSRLLRNLWNSPPRPVSSISQQTSAAVYVNISCWPIWKQPSM